MFCAASSAPPAGFCLVGWMSLSCSSSVQWPWHCAGLYFDSPYQPHTRWTSDTRFCCVGTMSTISQPLWSRHDNVFPLPRWLRSFSISTTVFLIFRWWWRPCSLSSDGSSCGCCYWVSDRLIVCVSSWSSYPFQIKNSQWLYTEPQNFPIFLWPFIGPWVSYDAMPVWRGSWFYLVPVSLCWASPWPYHRCCWKSRHYGHSWEQKGIHALERAACFECKTQSVPYEGSEHVDRLHAEVGSSEGQQRHSVGLSVIRPRGEGPTSTWLQIDPAGNQFLKIWICVRALSASF